MLPLVPILAIFGLSKAAQVPPTLENVHRIVMLGDSITQMGGAPKGFVTKVDQALKAEYPNHPIEVINAGISGEKATDMHARFQRDVIDRHPDIVTISVGVNDVWHDFRTPTWSARVPEGNSGRGVKLPVYIHEVEAMIQEAQKAGARVILLSPTLVYENLDCAENQRLTQYVRAEHDLARRDHADFVDLNKVYRSVVAEYQKYAGRSMLLLTIDGVHMNDQGNALMTGQILTALGVPIRDQIGP